MSETEKVACRTPAEGRKGITNIPRWKYDAVRGAILAILTDAGEEGFLFKDLSQAVAARLSENELERLGSPGWHVTTVKLNMEVEGEIMRVEKSKPQRITLRR